MNKFLLTGLVSLCVVSGFTGTAVGASAPQNATQSEVIIFVEDSNINDPEVIMRPMYLSEDDEWEDGE